MSINYLESIAARVKKLEEALKSARAALLLTAKACDDWATESRSGGWSTHQVQPNITRAHNLRVEADRIERVLNGESQ